MTTLTDTERVREVLADHFVMWFELSRLSGPPGEWRCQCGLKFGFSDSAIDHQAGAAAACVVEAVVRERATWATKIRALDTGYAGGGNRHAYCIDPRRLRALLPADDTAK